MRVITQAQFSLLIGVVIFSAVVPTAIAQRMLRRDTEMVNTSSWIHTHTAPPCPNWRQRCSRSPLLPLPGSAFPARRAASWSNRSKLR